MNLVNVARVMAKLEMATETLKFIPKKAMMRGFAIAPPPTPPIELTPLNTRNTKTPPHSIGNWGNTVLCIQALFTHTLNLISCLTFWVLIAFSSSYVINCYQQHEGYFFYIILYASAIIWYANHYLIIISILHNI